MKYVKMSGVAALAVVILVALVGAGTASATVLCKKPGEGTTTGTKCPAGQAYEAGTTFDAFLESLEAPMILKTKYLELKCPQSTVRGNTSNEGGEGSPVSIPLEFVTTGMCACAHLAMLSTGTLSIAWIEGTHNGTVTSSGTEFTTRCSGSTGEQHCIYETKETDLGTLKGGEPAILEIKATLSRKGTELFCASTMTWEGTYTVLGPESLYVAGET
jgi:hypothetical protein